MRGCKNVGRNDMQKVGRRARVQGRLARGHAETWQVCAGQGRNDMLKTGKCSRLQGRFPAAPPGKRRHAANFWMSLRGAKRRGNPHLLRQGMTESSTLGESEKCYEFALRIANLQSFSAGTRIAAPVCALVRNDMLKEEACVRLQGRLARGHAETWQVCAGQGRNDMQRTDRCSRLQGRFPAVPPGKRRHAANFWMSLRGAERRGNPHLLRQGMTESSTLGEYGKVHTNLPQRQPTCQVFLRGRGLPHQCAHWFAMTC